MSKARVYPSWRHHAEHGSKIIHSEEEHLEHEKQGWVQSKSMLKSEAQTPAPEEAPKGEPKIEKSEAEQIKELTKALIDLGFSKKELKGMSVEELSELLLNKEA